MKRKLMLVSLVFLMVFMIPTEIKAYPFDIDTITSQNFYSSGFENEVTLVADGMYSYLEDLKEKHDEDIPEVRL